MPQYKNLVAPGDLSPEICEPLTSYAGNIKLKFRTTPSQTLLFKKSNQTTNVLPPSASCICVWFSDSSEDKKYLSLYFIHTLSNYGCYVKRVRSNSEIMEVSGYCNLCKSRAWAALTHILKRNSLMEKFCEILVSELLPCHVLKFIHFSSWP